MIPPLRDSIAVEGQYLKQIPLGICKWMAPVILALADYSMIVIAIISAYFFRHNLLQSFFPTLEKIYIADSYLYIIIPFTYLSLMLYERMYTKRLPFWQCAECIFKVCTYSIVIVIGILYFSGSAHTISRIFIILTWILGFTGLLIGRFVTKRILLSIGLWQKPIIVIGAGKTAELLAKAFEDEPNMGYKIVGLIEDNYIDRPLIHKYQLIGTFATVEDTIINAGIKDVIIAAPGLGTEKLLELIHRVQPYVNGVAVIPNLFGLPLSNLEVETFFNEKAVMLRVHNNLLCWYNRAIKRCFDIVCSFCGIIILSPLLVLVAAFIFVTSPGPVIFGNERPGKNGKAFKCYKFRSMVMNAESKLQQYLNSDPTLREEWNKHGKLRNDPRVTKLGIFIRKTSIDELPQLFNVLIGNMSLVGPRPMLFDQIQQKKQLKCILGARVFDNEMVLPGITGLWQVSGRSDITFEERIQLESWYVRNWSLWLDIVILIKTVKVVLFRSGAY